MSKLSKNEDESPIAHEKGDSGKEKSLKAIHNASARELSKLRETIDMIADNDFSAAELKETIHSIISSKAIRRLDEIKTSIAANYFAKPSFSTDKE